MKHNYIQSLTAQYSEFQDAWKIAYSEAINGDKTKALLLFEKLASEGCHPAFGEIGKIYEIGGRCVARDVDKALEYYRIAAYRWGGSESCLGIGRIQVFHGTSEEDFAEAKECFEILTNFRQMAAFFGLGVVYEKGLGVPKNRNQAMGELRKASLLGHLKAKQVLASFDIENHPIKGRVRWLMLSWQIYRAILKNPVDPRVGLFYDNSMMSAANDSELMNKPQNIGHQE